MTAGSQIAGSANGLFDDDTLARTHAVRADRQSESLFRGRALEIICLAVALFLWGTSYKVSRFHPNPAAHTQLRVARCWLVPRTGEQTLALVAHLQPTPAQGDHASLVQSAADVFLAVPLLSFPTNHIALSAGLRAGLRPRDFAAWDCAIPPFRKRRAEGWGTHFQCLIEKWDTQPGRGSTWLETRAMSRWVLTDWTRGERELRAWKGIRVWRAARW